MESIIKKQKKGDKNMALLTVNLQSNTLRTGTSITVILPQKKFWSTEDVPPHQTLYFFSGGFTDHTYTQRNTAIERLATEYNVAVVMPYMAGRYLYKNMPHGEQWWTYYSEELPAICENMFRLSRNREDTFVAGGSGGGYAALKLALEKPERFGAVAGMCPMLFSQRALEGLKESSTMAWRYEELSYIYGKQLSPEYDVFEILKASSEKEQQAAMYLCCGTEDKLFDLNAAFRDKAVELGFNPTWDQRPGGHTMEYSDEMLPEVLNWFTLKKL